MATPAFLPSSLAHKIALTQETVRKPPERELLLGGEREAVRPSTAMEGGAWGKGEAGTNARRPYFSSNMEEYCILKSRCS